MIAAIMQPAYLPWLGYFDRVRRADLLIVLDHVAMDRNSKTKFANRNKIRTPNGWMWLTVPIETKGARDTPLNDLAIVGDDWRRQHRATIGQFYRHARFYDSYAMRLDAVYAAPMRTLAAAAAVTAGFLSEVLGITTRSVPSSTLNPTATKSELILELCKLAGASVYLSGPFGRDYLDLAAFSREGVEVVFHDYVSPKYEQAHAGFEPYMSALDLVLNHGPESRAILEARSEALISGASVS